MGLEKRGLLEYAVEDDEQEDCAVGGEEGLVEGL